jgi:hypothetical protein
MFESGMFRARALAAGGRYAAGMLRPMRSSATQSVAAASAAFSNADAGELPADGAQALNLPRSSGPQIPSVLQERARPTHTPGGLERIPKQ